MNTVFDTCAQKDRKRVKSHLKAFCRCIQQHWFGITKFQSTFTENKPDIINSFISRKILPTTKAVTVLTSIAKNTIAMVFFNAGITQHDFKSEC
jgi:hypothetical protein